MIVESLFIYPVKSLGGVSVDQLEFGQFGVKNDRRYLLVDSKHRFLTQRSHSILSQFLLEITPNGWAVTGPSGSTCVIPLIPTTNNLISTKVWKAQIKCLETDVNVSQWFSDQLDQPVFLVEFYESEQRRVEYEAYSQALAFADGYPLLVCNQQSLNDLNSKLDTAITMQRFRPNVVYSNDAGSEYQTQGLQAGGGELLFVEPCVRCNVPAIEPATSVFQRSVHQQLKSILVQNGKVIFGMNALSRNLTVLNVGDSLTELSGQSNLIFS